MLEVVSEHPTDQVKCYRVQARVDEGHNVAHNLPDMPKVVVVQWGVGSEVVPHHKYMIGEKTNSEENDERESDFRHLDTGLHMFQVSNITAAVVGEVCP